jgi:hypothetical protein
MEVAWKRHGSCGACSLPLVQTCYHYSYYSYYFYYFYYSYYYYYYYYCYIHVHTHVPHAVVQLAWGGLGGDVPRTQLDVGGLGQDALPTHRGEALVWGR